MGVTEHRSRVSARAVAALRAGLLLAAACALAACTPPGPTASAPGSSGSPSVAAPGSVSASPLESPGPAESEGYPVPSDNPTAVATADPPLAGVVVVVDPGHQLGNRHFPAQVGAIVDAGMGVRKACNTTGTATPDDVPEATITWGVAQALTAGLESAGAQVVLTRDSDDDALWGPCVDVRGSLANDRAAALVSLHGDGAPSGEYGFHLLVPGPDQATHAESVRLAEALRARLDAAGLPRATYVADAIRASNDYGTLNLSSKPAVIVEMGNLRNASDAATLTDPAGQLAVAQAVAAGVQDFIDDARGGASS